MKRSTFVIPASRSSRRCRAIRRRVNHDPPSAVRSAAERPAVSRRIRSTWETIVDGSQWVLIHDFPTQHEGYNHPSVTAAIRMETGYPHTALDMVYFFPALARKDGRPIGATQATQI